MFPREIRTDRLRLDRLSRETVAVATLYEHVNVDAPEAETITEYTTWEPHRTMKDTHDYLTDVEAAWDDRTQATYAVYPRDGDDEGAFAGVTNLNVGWEKRAAELGIWLRPRFWGRGYSGERAGALFDLAFDRLDLEVVGAAHQAGNDRSKRAVEKYVDAYGGQYDGVLRNWVPTGDEVRDLHRYTVTQEQYRDATA